MIVLDTNVVSEAMKPAPDRRAMAWLRAQALTELATTAVTLAEIDHGLWRLPRGRRRDDLTGRVKAFMRMASASASSRSMPARPTSMARS